MDKTILKIDKANRKHKRDLKKEFKGISKEEFLYEVKKIFPNATDINLNYIKSGVDYCWCYGGISKSNYPIKDHYQINKINEMARMLKCQ